MIRCVGGQCMLTYVGKYSVGSFMFCVTQASASVASGGG